MFLIIYIIARAIEQLQKHESNKFACVPSFLFVSTPLVVRPDLFVFEGVQAITFSFVGSYIDQIKGRVNSLHTISKRTDLGNLPMEYFKYCLFTPCPSISGVMNEAGRDGNYLPARVGAATSRTKRSDSLGPPPWGRCKCLELQRGTPLRKTESPALSTRPSTRPIYTPCPCHDRMIKAPHALLEVRCDMSRGA